MRVRNGHDPLSFRSTGQHILSRNTGAQRSSESLENMSAGGDSKEAAWTPCTLVFGFPAAVTAPVVGKTLHSLRTALTSGLGSSENGLGW